MLNEDNFFILSFVLLFFVCYLSVQENRRQEDRKDYRRDLDYTRQLHERREFGYEAVENSVNNRPIRRRFLKKK